MSYNLNPLQLSIHDEVQDLKCRVHNPDNRVPSHEHQYIAWALDAGASAVVLPHASIFPPDGPILTTGRNGRTSPSSRQSGPIPDGALPSFIKHIRSIRDSARTVLRLSASHLSLISDQERDRADTQFGGVRSAPPNALLWGFNDGHPEGGAMPGIFNRAGLIMQIESRAGVKIAEDIAAVEGGWYFSTSQCFESRD